MKIPSTLDELRALVASVSAGFSAGAKEGGDSDTLETLSDQLDGVADTKLAGKTQVKVVAITAAANAAPVTLATATAKACLIKSLVIRSAAAITADLTSFNVKGGASSAVEFIDDVTGARANVAAEDEQVSWTGAVVMPATGTITFAPTGTGATALDMVAIIEYVAVEDTGYLA